MGIKVYEHKVQYYETDQMKVVHHSNYIRWFEEARMYWMEEMGMGYEQMEDAGIISPVVEVSAKYKSMTHFGDTVCIEIKIETYNGVKLCVDYVVRDKESGEIRCTGKSTNCFVDSKGNVLIMKKAHPEFDQLFRSMSE